MATGVAKEADEDRHRHGQARRKAGAEDGRRKKAAPLTRAAAEAAVKLFPFGHATHPQWRMAAGLVLAQLRAQMALPDYAQRAHAGPALHHRPLRGRGAGHPGPPGRRAAGGHRLVRHRGRGHRVHQRRILRRAGAGGDAVRAAARPVPRVLRRGAAGGGGMGFEPHTALVHADAGTPDVAELIAEMAARTATGYLFGGLASSRADTVQFAVGGNGNIKGQGAAGGVFRGGLSGVAFGEGVRAGLARDAGLPAGRGAAHVITAAEGNVVTELDGEPALDVLLRDTGHLAGRSRRPAMRGAARHAGRPDRGRAATRSGRTGNFGTDVRRAPHHRPRPGAPRRGGGRPGRAGHAPGLLPAQRAGRARRPDAHLRRDPRGTGARGDCRWPVASRARRRPRRRPRRSPARRIAGAVYVSCAGRGGPHFGGPSAELQIVRRALGDVPLVGFFAGGEIARHHLYGYTGVLTVFRLDMAARSSHRMPGHLAGRSLGPAAGRRGRRHVAARGSRGAPCGPTLWHGKAHAPLDGGGVRAAFALHRPGPSGRIPARHPALRASRHGLRRPRGAAHRPLRLARDGVPPEGASSRSPPARPLVLAELAAAARLRLHAAAAAAGRRRRARRANCCSRSACSGPRTSSTGRSRWTPACWRSAGSASTASPAS